MGISYMFISFYKTILNLWIAAFPKMKTEVQYYISKYCIAMQAK